VAPRVARVRRCRQALDRAQRQPPNEGRRGRELRRDHRAHVAARKIRNTARVDAQSVARSSLVRRLASLPFFQSARMARGPLSLHPCAGVDRCPRASVASRYGDTKNAVDRSDTRRPLRRAEVSAPRLASVGGSRVFARPRNATEASATSAPAKRDKHPIRLHLVLAGRERFGCGSRRRRRRRRESRHEPVADDRRAGGAGVRVLAEPGRDPPTAPLGSRYERLEPAAPATRPRAAVTVPRAPGRIRRRPCAQARRESLPAARRHGC
jgi:hypothetical protein